MLVLGHRGGRGEGWPAENTLAAIERAKREGADGVEIDVRSCATGEIVVFHDADLRRAAGDPRLVEDLPASDLLSVPLFGGGERMPLLADVLDFCKAESLMLNVEIKYDLRDKSGLVGAVTRALARSSLRLVVSSFDPRILWQARAQGLHAPTAWLTDRKQRYSMALVRLLARRPLFSAVHLERTQVTDARVKRLRRRGLRVGVWTVNDREEANRLDRSGVDWIVTDSPGGVR